MPLTFNSQIHFQFQIHFLSNQVLVGLEIQIAGIVGKHYLPFGKNAGNDVDVDIHGYSLQEFVLDAHAALYAYSNSP